MNESYKNKESYVLTSIFSVVPFFIASLWSDKIKSLINKPVSWLRSSQLIPIDLDTTIVTSLPNPRSSVERGTRSPMLHIETQLREERVDRETMSTRATDLEQSKLYPSLIEYLSTEAGQVKETRPHTDHIDPHTSTYIHIHPHTRTTTFLLSALETRLFI